MEVEKIPGFRSGSTYFTCEANEGFFFRSKTYKNGVTYLVCVEKDCRARASCNEMVFLKFDTVHNHLADLTKKEALLLKKTMVTKAVSSTEEIRTIFVGNSASATIDAATKVVFPRVSRCMCRERRKHQPQIPTSLDEYGTVCGTNLRFGLVDEKPFCRGAIGEGAGVFFLAKDLENLLSAAKEVHLDGTFKTRPRFPQSNQLLTIMAIQYGVTFPCVFVLMADRKRGSYDKVFEKLKEIVPSFDPQLIMTDYESALIKSLKENFPAAHKTGCFFHYCQAVTRRACVLGMKRLIKSSTSAKKALKLLLCLPLLPAEKFPNGVEHVNTFLREKNLQEDFNSLMRYHQRQWMGRVGADSISVYKRTRRTNNDCESFHAALQRLLRVRGPNAWEFTDGIRSITATVIRERAAFIDGGLPIRSLGRRGYRLNNKRISDATALFDANGDVGAFLNMVSYCVEGIVQENFASEEPEREGEEDEGEEDLEPLDSDVPLQYVAVDNTDTDTHADVINEADAEEGDLVEEISEHSVDRNIGMCIICRTAPPTTVLLPCKHFGLCDECCTTRQRLNALPPQPEDVAYDNVVDHSICPLDRLQVEEYLRVVVS